MRNGFLHLQNQPVKFRVSFFKTSTYWVLTIIFNGDWIECVLLGTILNGDQIKWCDQSKELRQFNVYKMRSNFNLEFQ